MAFVIADRVRETTTTIGTGSVTLGGAYTSFQTFSAAIGNGNNTYYTIASASSGEWEVGIGTYASGGNLLSRDTVLASSNAGNLVNFSVGSKDVFVTQPSERSLLLNSGSTGLFAGNAAFTANGIPYANSTTTLTTGSALTFDGTTFATTGRTSSANGAWVASGAVMGWGAAGTFTNYIVGDTASNYLLFQVNSAEGMRLTSTGLGIGTSSPWSQLTVGSGGTANPASTVTFHKSTASEYRLKLTSSLFNSDGAWLGLGFGYSDNYMKAAIIAEAKDANARANLHFVLQADANSTNASLSDSKMVLTYSGNLGIGTTSPATKLHVSGSGNQAVTIQSTGSGVPYLAMTLNSVGTQYIYANVGSSQNMTFEVAGSERMRLDASGNLGIGTSSPATKLDVQISSGRFQIYPAVTATGVRLLSVNTGNSAAVPMEISGTDIRFTNSSNTLVGIFDSSGNLGIGTSSPGAKLDVNGGTNSEMRLTTSGSGYLQVGQFTNGAFIGTSSTDPTAGILRLGTGGTTRATIDASGNLGLGVTPSAWTTTAGISALQVSSRVALWGDTTQTILSNNMYASSTGDRYIATANASLYTQISGQHRWLTAASGNAGDPITFTQAMTLDASGNLGVGTTSPATRVHAMSSSSALSFGLSPSNSNTNIGYVTNDSTYIMFASGYGSTGQKFRVALQAPDNAATIDSSGNLGVGTTTLNVGTYGKAITLAATASAYGGLELSGTTGGAIDFQTSQSTRQVQLLGNSNGFLMLTNGGSGLTERARITSGGDLLVGTTNTDPSGNSVDGSAFLLSGSALSANRSSGCWGFIGRSTTTGDVITWRYGGTTVGSISVTGSATAYNTSSDYRLKEDVQPMTGALAKVAALKPCTYKWKSDGSDGEGFIAHELAEVVPQCVTGEKDAVDADGKPIYQGIDTSFLVATLTAAIQELKAEFDAYKATHP